MTTIGQAAEMSGNDASTARPGMAEYRALLATISEIEDQLKNGKRLGFPYLVRGDIADGHMMGFRPVTFLRQVVSVCSFPEIADNMPSDVAQRARDILSHCPGGSIGSIPLLNHPVIHEHIAEYISQRDFVRAKPEDVWVTNGVIHGFSIILQVLKRRLNGRPPGALTCVPQFLRFYTLLKRYGYHEMGYYLDEDRGWAHNVDEMQKALNESKSVCVPRCLLLINPSNPPGTVLSRQQLQDIIVFAHKNHLIILADEVFEHNTYDSKLPFCSVRNVMNSMGLPYSRTPLVSFNSISKGYACEAGLRSGYFEAINLDSVDQENLEEAMGGYRPSVLCQAALDCIVKPPELGDPSYELYAKERTSTLESLAKRVKMAEERLNAIEGFHCGPVQASMAAYPRVDIPAKAIEEAKRMNKEADVFYAEELLKNKGVTLVPSSAFGRLPGRYHFRIIILSPEDKLVELFDRLEAFHKDFMVKYA